MPRKPRIDDYDRAPTFPEFDPPPRYWIARTARTLGHLVMRRAVLRPVVGRMHGRTFQRVIDRYLHIVRGRWAALATDLPDDPRPPIACVAERLQSLLNCPPPFVLVSPRGRPCGDPSLCPSCWAREAAGHRKSLDLALFGELPARNASLLGVTILVRETTYRIARPRMDAHGEPVDPDRFIPLAAFLDRRVAQRSRTEFASDVDRPGMLPRLPTEIAAWRRRGVACGLDVTRLACKPTPPAVCPPPEWAVRITAILFAPSASARRLAADCRFTRAPGIGGEVYVPGGEVALTGVDAPTRRDLALACARAFRYPADARAFRYPADLLIRGDRASVAGYLDARYRRRLVAAFGDPDGLRATPARRDRPAPGNPQSPVPY